MALPDRSTRRIPHTILLGVDAPMAISEENIFGPALAVRPYDSVDDVIMYLNARPAPLVAYFYGDDLDTLERFRMETRSGGISRNDFAAHARGDDLPFGGIGRSGMGSYHGRAGFDTFSRRRPVAGSSAIGSAALSTVPARMDSDQLERLRTVIADTPESTMERLRSAGLTQDMIPSTVKGLVR